MGVADVTLSDLTWAKIMFQDEVNVHLYVCAALGQLWQQNTQQMAMK